LVSRLGDSLLYKPGDWANDVIEKSRPIITKNLRMGMGLYKNNMWVLITFKNIDLNGF